MASDFHTHHPKNNIRALVSSPYLLEGMLTSLEYHPWSLPENFDPSSLPSIIDAAKFSAIGEIGLDKVRGADWQIQEKYFRSMLDMAADLNKPAVIHCVRSWSEIFATLQRYQLKVMIHGFRSSPEMLDELWKRNFTVSFHPAAAKNPALMNKLKNARGSFGFESDSDPDVDLPALISAVSAQIAVPDLEKISDQHFTDFLEI